jgi:hypothetical protein
LLHLPKKIIEALLPGGRPGQVIRKCSGVAEVNQQPNLLGAEAYQVLIAMT